MLTSSRVGKVLSRTRMTMTMEARLLTMGPRVLQIPRQTVLSGYVGTHPATYISLTLPRTRSRSCLEPRQSFLRLEGRRLGQQLLWAMVETEVWPHPLR